MDTSWHYAVVVGIDKYPRIDNGRFDLRCPPDDARKVGAWLVSSQGGNIDESRVKVLTRSTPGGRAPPVPVFDEINAAILDCVTEFVDRRTTTLPNESARKLAWQNSRFYFYVSGHGMDGDGDDAVLITANATRASMNHISARNVINQLRKHKVFGELVVLADCCRDLAGVAVQDLPWDLNNFSGFNDPVRPRSFIAYASRNLKKAFEPSKGAALENSIFTQALLEGLSGGVPGNEVNSANLADFLYNYVPKLAQQSSNSDQNPDIKADPGIIFIRTSKLYGVTITARPGSIYASLPAVDALDSAKSAEQNRNVLPAVRPGVFEGCLGTGYYAIVPPGGNPFRGSPVFPLCVLGEDINESFG